MTSNLFIFLRVPLNWGRNIDRFFFGYTFSDAWITRRTSNDKEKLHGRKRPWTMFRCHACNCLQRPRKTTETSIPRPILELRTSWTEVLSRSDTLTTTLSWGSEFWNKLYETRDACNLHEGTGTAHGVQSEDWLKGRNRLEDLDSAGSEQSQVYCFF